MPWYVVAYVIVLAMLGVYSFYDDLRSVPAWYLGVDAVVSLFWILAVFAYYDSRFSVSVSAGLALLIAALLWTAWDVRRELEGIVKQRSESNDPELSPEMNLWIDRGVEVAGVLVGVAILTPALVMAVRVLQRVAE